MTAAITTVYRGIEYRSRLEARWASFMQKIGWDITYEPFDGERYIPDFIVEGDRPFLVEVKPATTHTDYEAAVPKVERGLRGTWPGDILIVGVSPFIHSKYDFFWGGRSAVGWFGEYLGEDKYGWEWEHGQWITCRTCDQTAVMHPIMSFGGRPCWCHMGGDGHLGDPGIRFLEQFWADAINDVKWRGRPA